ncbi:RagB/SusD family nutrient uptake outer membrane protein [Flavobacterium macrobrachii]|jgi:hypothetical protein|uniref:RagB/SusD family nutrient uptake outer membrane protein n=1 Tax=Flavobacterium macrobrachii TaxID=591204 RepID=A0ABS2CZ17_9FLAO|nr:RagB/SusD family nutrient uptake outer membrane protein [Flavobacterium macrobrachii]MBM6500203.1 RagB/SusD family nutrient uptake outer membrane protein [Flavobacterium macrobrachii]PZO30520.1 MAG: RagB/SusD family nutrient uptake outer membrane protein [Flavobacteriaceae bacterium]
MKINFINKSFFAIMIFSVISCEDKMDEYIPYDQEIFENFYKSPADFEQAKNAMYSAFRGNGYFSGGGSGDGLISTPDIMSDNLVLNTEGRQSGRVNAEFTFNSNNVPNGMYGTAYRIISRANSIIDRINVLPDGDFKNNILGQALAVRAICHFDVARAYAKIPTQSANANQSLGIAYVKTFNPQQLPTRLATVEETYNEIINDLELASQIIAVENTVDATQAGTNVFLDRVSVKALLSRVYLYNGNYALAAQRAQEAIDLGATLGTRAQFPGIWNDSNNSDILFKIAITVQDDVQIGVDYFQFLSGAFFSEYVCDFDFYNLYLNNDVRKSAYFTVAQSNGSEYIHITKYYRDLTNQRFLDGKYIRTSEVYLNLAEAKARLGNDDTGALAALNALRAQRYTGFVSGNETGSALLNQILLQRRLELAFEGDRFFTLKRLGLPLQRSGKGHLSDGTGNISVPQTLSADDHRWQWPIDQTTLNINPNIQQNPNYSAN